MFSAQLATDNVSIPTARKTCRYKNQHVSIPLTRVTYLRLFIVRLLFMYRGFSSALPQITYHYRGNRGNADTTDPSRQPCPLQSSSTLFRVNNARFVSVYRHRATTPYRAALFPSTRWHTTIIAPTTGSSHRHRLHRARVRARFKRVTPVYELCEKSTDLDTIFIGHCILCFNTVV